MWSDPNDASRMTPNYAFGLYSSGDMSIGTAAAKGGIKTIRHVDYEYTNDFFFAYQEMTMIVYGD